MEGRQSEDSSRFSLFQRSVLHVSNRFPVVLSAIRGAESTFPNAPWVSTEVPLLTVTSSGSLQTKAYPRSVLNGLYADVGLVKPLIQCEEEDGTCAEMTAEVSLWRNDLGVWGAKRGKWKYVLDLGEWDVICY
jgi:hypothetical protein